MLFLNPHFLPGENMGSITLRVTMTTFSNFLSSSWELSCQHHCFCFLNRGCLWRQTTTGTGDKKKKKIPKKSLKSPSYPLLCLSFVEKPVYYGLTTDGCTSDLTQHHLLPSDLPFSISPITLSPPFQCFLKSNVYINHLQNLLKHRFSFSRCKMIWRLCISNKLLENAHAAGLSSGKAPFYFYNWWLEGWR